MRLFARLGSPSPLMTFVEFICSSKFCLAAGLVIAMDWILLLRRRSLFEWLIRIAPAVIFTTAGMQVFPFKRPLLNFLRTVFNAHPVIIRPPFAEDHGVHAVIGPRRKVGKFFRSETPWTTDNRQEDLGLVSGDPRLSRCVLTDYAGFLEEYFSYVPETDKFSGVDAFDCSAFLRSLDGPLLIASFCLYPGYFQDDGDHSQMAAYRDVFKCDQRLYQKACHSALVAQATDRDVILTITTCRDGVFHSRHNQVEVILPVDDFITVSQPDPVHEPLQARIVNPPANLHNFLVGGRLDVKGFLNAATKTHLIVGIGAGSSPFWAQVHAQSSRGALSSTVDRFGGGFLMSPDVRFQRTEQKVFEGVAYSYEQGLRYCFEDGDYGKAGFVRAWCDAKSIDNRFPVMYHDATGLPCAIESRCHFCDGTLLYAMQRNRRTVECADCGQKFHANVLEEELDSSSRDPWQVIDGREDGAIAASEPEPPLAHHQLSVVRSFDEWLVTSSQARRSNVHLDGFSLASKHAYVGCILTPDSCGPGSGAVIELHGSWAKNDKLLIGMWDLDKSDIDLSFQSPGSEVTGGVTGLPYASGYWISCTSGYWLTSHEDATGANIHHRNPPLGWRPPTKDAGVTWGIQLLPSGEIQFACADRGAPLIWGNLKLHYGWCSSPLPVKNLKRLRPAVLLQPHSRQDGTSAGILLRDAQGRAFR